MPENKDLFKKMKRQLFLLGLFKIPMVGFVRPKLIALNDQEAIVEIKLRRRTKNHLNSMYFGALAVGADLAAGLHTFYFADAVKGKLSFAFKAMHAEFYKRAESAVYFESRDAALIQAAISESVEFGERVNRVVDVLAYDAQRELVASFKMTVSIKFK